MPSGSSKSSKSSKPKPSDVAAETKKYYIPLIKKNYSDTWKTSSLLYRRPCALEFGRSTDLLPPSFCAWVAAEPLPHSTQISCYSKINGPPDVYNDDPVDFAIRWATMNETPVAFICAANDKRPGGDWETGVIGYEERLCRRSNLSATLSHPEPESGEGCNYPIPIEGGIYSESVVVFRGPHDRYEKLAPEDWRALPVVSVPPERWPKLNQNGTKYSFQEERELVKNKLRAALTICAWHSISSVVIGDFGLGNGYRNPPQELAELWREVLLWDPVLRGRIQTVAFVFEDHSQSTAKLILDDIAKKSKGGSSSSSGKGKGKSSSSSNSGSSHHSSGSSSGSSSASSGYPTDHQIFQHVFDPNEIQRVLSQPDPRLGLGNLIM